LGSSRLRSPGCAAELLHKTMRDAEQLGDVPDRQAESLAKLKHGRCVLPCASACRGIPIENLT